MNIKLNKRDSDKWGAGYYGAPRGERTHTGIDYCCPAGSEVLSPCSGEVTKLGFPYGDDLSFRYVQVTSEGKDHRIFYIEPTVEVGDIVISSDVIGTAQNLEERYPGITPHIHYEIMIGKDHANPEDVC